MLRRGFKSQCERRSVEIRKGFGLKPDDPLSAFKLATSLNVVVWSEQKIVGVSNEDIRQLTTIDSSSWSAFTIRVNDNYLIVFNSSQPLPRQNSVLMHELSHIVLGHKLTSAGLTKDGHFIPTCYDQVQENEADWLAGTLLLPRPALLKVRYSLMSNIDAMLEYEVSQKMLDWRYRMTGVDFQLANARKKKLRQLDR